MYGMIDTSGMPTPTVRPQENYGNVAPNPNSLLDRLSTLRQQSSGNPIQLAANNIGDKIANAGARGMQFVYSDVPNAIGNLLGRAKSAMTPSSAPTAPVGRGIGISPQRSAELEVVNPSQRQQMNDVLNQIDRGY